MIEYVEYKGQELPFLYDFYVISRLRVVKEKNENIETFELVDYLIYYSIKNGCNEINRPFTITVNDKERELTIEDAGFIYGKLGQEKLDKLLVKFVGEAVEDKDSKKK